MSGHRDARNTYKRNVTSQGFRRNLGQAALEKLRKRRRLLAFARASLLLFAIACLLEFAYFTEFEGTPVVNAATGQKAIVLEASAESDAGAREARGRTRKKAVCAFAFGTCPASAAIFS